MVALIESPAGPRPQDTTPPDGGRAPRRRPRLWRGVVLGIAAVYFILPLYAALKFALSKPGGGITFSAFSSIPSQLGFSAAFELSLRLALVTTVITLVLMVPTAVFVHLRYPNLRRLFDGITILPIVIPPVVLIVGVLEVAPTFLKSTPYLLSLEYVVLAMPFAYRSLDAGLQAMDLKTLVEAGRSLGSRSVSTLLRVVIPNLRSAILSATVLTVALVLGEYTMATLDLFQTFPVWIVVNDQVSAQVSVAASLLALFVTWLVLMLITLIGTRQSRRRGGGEVTLFTGTALRPPQTIGN
jgi:putative spermidine/putrescine transport system permease protein